MAQADLGENLASAGILLAAAQRPPGRRDLATEGEVLGDREVGGDHRLLRDEADAQALRGGRRRDGDLVAEELKGARIGTQDAGEDLAERGLARTVGPDEAVTLGGADSHIDAAQGLGAAEALAHAADSEGRLAEVDRSARRGCRVA